MITGIGGDIVDIRRIRRVLRRHPRRLPARILSEREKNAGKAPADEALFLAGRWAAKEAVGKALGGGLRAPVTWRQISVINDAAGRPAVVFEEAARRHLSARGVARCHVSIAHDGDYALATAVAEADE